LASFGGRSAGYVFNQTMVQTKWTKCSYIWDGASFNLMNRGCGDGANSAKCGPNEDNAFNNKCGDHTCTADDDVVKRSICDVAGGSRPVPKVHASESQCVFPGPAFDFHGQEDFTPGKDYTHLMGEQRMLNNAGTDTEGPNVEKNNEVVLDEELFIPDLWKDPEEFRPERFLEEDEADGTYAFRGPTMGKTDQTTGKPVASKFVAFAYGQRSCPGYRLGRVSVFLQSAMMIQCFDWERTEDSDLSPHTRLITFPKKLKCRAKYRLKKPLDELLKTPCQPGGGWFE